VKANISLLHWVGRPRSFVVRYGIALLAVMAATSTRLAVDRVVPEAVPFAFDFLAILVTTAAGGIGPGILAAGLATIATWLLFVTRTLHISFDHIPRLSEIPSVDDLVAFVQNPVFLSRGALTNLAIFIVTSSLMIMGAAALRNAIIRRRNSERELQESERRFRIVTDTMPQLVWSTLPDGSYDYYNQRCIEFAGMPPDSDGGSWKKLLHPDDRVRTRETWTRALKTGRPYEIEHRFRGADEEYHWFLGRAVPVRNGEGKIERWFGSSTDISDIVSARETLAHAKGEQERLVTERTVELAQANDRLRAEMQERTRAEEKLRQAHKMEALGQLTGGVAHDFNNLLTVVIGNIEAIGRRLGADGDSTVRNYADSAMQGARRAAALTQRLLAFARGQPLEPKSTDINTLLSGMSELLVRTLGERVSMQTIFANGLWPIEVDPNHFESVLLNLAANSRDAMPDGGTLTIETSNKVLDRSYASAHSEVTPGNYVLVSVRDTGTGMSKETLAHVFEPFFTTKPVGQGTGLGLSQLYGFMKQSGGHVHIDSTIGKGTTVDLYLPRHVDEQAEFVTKQKEEAPETQKQETVLAVEDDEDVRRYAVSMLRELGYKVLEAADGEAALRLLESHPEIRFLFSDVGLPGGYNGRQLADEALRRRPYLKVLFTTGYGLDGIIHDGRLDPDVQLITKPFTFDDFADKIRKVFDMSSKGKILLVEDESLVAMVAAETLREMGFEVEEAATVAAALKCAKTGIDGFAAAIIDIGLPDGKGDALAKELKNIRPNLPIIIATGQGDGALDGHLKKTPQLTLLSKPYDSEGLRKSLATIGLN
jgi:PAS domain S-box-containing protein